MMTLTPSMISRSIDKAVDRLIETRHREAQRDKDNIAASCEATSSKKGPTSKKTSFTEESIIYLMEATRTSRNEALKMLQNASSNEGSEKEHLKKALTQFLRV